MIEREEKKRKDKEGNGRKWRNNRVSYYFMFDWWWCWVGRSLYTICWEKSQYSNTTRKIK